MKKFKIKFKIKFQKINQYFYFLTIITTAVILFFVSMFLYKNFYLAITQSEEILILQKEVVSETVNMNKFNEIIEKINKKTKLRELNDINNPFD